MVIRPPSEISRKKAPFGTAFVCDMVGIHPTYVHVPDLCKRGAPITIDHALNFPCGGFPITNYETLLHRSMSLLN